MRNVGVVAKNRIIVTFGYYILFIAGDVLVRPPMEARSAVLEQMDNGLISEWNGGVLEGTPPQDDAFSPDVFPLSLGASPGEGISKRGPGDPRSASSIVLDLDPDISTQRRRRSAGLARFGAGGKAMPPPRALTASFSREQRKMRVLATQIGLRFSRAEGVAKAGLDQNSFVTLFTAMIHRESNFNEKAVSPAGARGLGQLMPETARAMGVCDVFSGRDNLEGAARYLTLMLAQFASPSLALAAYNAGPGAVQRYRGIPPYPETRQYVADIIHALSIQQQTAAQAPLNTAALMDIGDRDFEPFQPDDATRCTRITRQ